VHEVKASTVVTVHKKSQLNLVSDFIEWVSICVLGF
jgi:hypothetical protein